jgi:hypothetical protein
MLLYKRSKSSPEDGVPENDCRLGVSSNCSFLDGLFEADLERDDRTDDGVVGTDFERFERRVSSGLYQLIS